MSGLECDLEVRSYELDSLGHVNHAVYLNYFEQARYDFLEAGGFDLAEMARRGWGVHVVRLEVDYRRECFLGQQLRIRTWVERFRKSSMTIRHELCRCADGPDADPAVSARVVAVWVGAEGRPIRIPEAARESLEAVAQPGPETGHGNPNPPVQNETR